MTRFIFGCAALVCAFEIGACGEPTPKREWQPSDHGQPSGPAPNEGEGESDSTQAPESASEASVRAARALFVAACASCHGRDGRGQGEARPPGATLPDFAAAAWQATRTDAQLLQTIRDGRGMMPAFGKRLNDEGLAVLVRYVRSFAAGETAAPAADDPHM